MKTNSDKMLKLWDKEMTDKKKNPQILPDLEKHTEEKLENEIILKISDKDALKRHYAPSNSKQEVFSSITFTMEKGSSKPVVNPQSSSSKFNNSASNGKCSPRLFSLTIGAG